MCSWIPHKEKEFTIDDVKKAIDVFNTAGKLMYKNGLKFCYHPHGYEFIPYENGTLFDYMVKHTDPNMFIMKWMYFGLSSRDRIL